MTKRFYMSAIALGVAATFLTACGGGGGGDSSIAQTPPTQTPPAPAPISGDSTVVNTITAAKYAAGSEELAAFNLINTERQRCGFGTLLQNAALDQAARAHADWQIINSRFSHNEISGTPGFTGFTPTGRAVAAGYVPVGFVIEDLAFGSSNSTLGRGEAGVRELLAAPYHLAGLLSPGRDIGISVRAPLDVGKTTFIPVTGVSIGTSTDFQLPATNEVHTYPCEGTTGVDYGLHDEEPNPVPGRNLFGQPLGHAIMVVVRRGQKLVINSATMNRVSDGANIVLRSPITGANDPNPGHLLLNEGYVIPDNPLSPLTSYAVSIDGTNNGTTFNRSFTFTTGTGDGNSFN